MSFKISRPESDDFGYTDDFDDSGARAPHPNRTSAGYSTNMIHGDSFRDSLVQPDIAFPARKKLGFSMACDTHDFSSHADAQTDSLLTGEAWTQSPCYSELGFSGFVEVATGRRIGSMTSASHKKVDNSGGRLQDFVARSGNLVLGMLSEGRHRRAVRQSQLANKDGMIISQVTLELPVLGDICDVGRVYLQRSTFPVLTVTHRLKNVTTTEVAATGQQGMVSLWNCFAPDTPMLILAAFEIVTCAATIAASGVEFVVAGSADGSVLCWDLRAESAEGLFENENAGVSKKLGSIRAPSFVTCGVSSVNHSRPVIDIVQLNDQSSTPGAEIFTTVLSLDEDGVVLVWCLTLQESDATQSVGGAPGCRVALIRRHRLIPPPEGPLPHRLFDAGNSEFLLSTSLDGTVTPLFLNSNLQQRGRSSKQPGLQAVVNGLSLSPFDYKYMLVYGQVGNLSLYNVIQNKEILTWTTPNMSVVRAGSWSEINPWVCYTVDQNLLLTRWTLSDYSSSPSYASSQISMENNSSSGAAEKVMDVVIKSACVVVRLENGFRIILLNEMLDEPTAEQKSRTPFDFAKTNLSSETMVNGQ